MNINKDGIDCKHFNGYKPCFPGLDCSEECQRKDPIGKRILIVNLDAMGDVLMTTAQLAGIKRAWPASQIFWITRSNAAALLKFNTLIDRVFVWDDVSRMILAAQTFDVVLSADKSADACSFVSTLQCDDVRGFTFSHRGQIVPANPEAEYNFRMGLDDYLKFRVNKRSGQDILAETWKLPYQGDEYILTLSDDEQAFCAGKRHEWGLEGKTVVGFNTGCSLLFPNKKMTVQQHVELITPLLGRDDLVVLLFGGPEDSERNREIFDLLRSGSNAPADGMSVDSDRSTADSPSANPEADRILNLISTPTGEGLRRGICYENLADIVVTGDSFGMHLAIGLRKHVLAWFGLSCSEEVDVYGRGRKFIPEGLDCAPCWKQSCPYNLECIDMIDLDGIGKAILEFAGQHDRTMKEASAR